MNEGNNLNSQFNNQAHNNSTQSVKNKFFPTGMFNDTDINDVNSSTSGDANSQFISRKTWGVGGNNYNNQLNNKDNITTSPEVLDLFDNEIETLMDDVNGTTYNVMNSSQDTNYNQNNYMNNNQVQNNNNVSSMNPNMNANQQNWMEQQPLSMGGLGVNTIVGEDAPKEIVEDSKFIMPRNYEFADNKITIPDPSLTNNQKNPFDFDEPPQEIDEVKLCKEYVGQEFTKITMAPFSFPALLLGGTYIAYRKMYIYGLLTIMIELALLNVLPIPINFVCVFIFRLILALSVNQFYLNLVSKKIHRLRKHNPKKTQYELSLKVHKMGGTNILISILFLLGYGFLIFIIGIAFNFKDLLNMLPENDTPVVNEDSKGVTGFNGDFTYEDYNVANYFKINIPNNFKQQGSNFTYVYVVPLPVVENPNSNTDNSTDNNSSDNVNQDTENNEEKEVEVKYSNNKCTLSFNAIKGYKNEEDLIKSIAYYYTRNEDEDILELNNNQIKWYAFDFEKRDEKNFYRVTKKDDKLLLLSYKMENEDENKICESYFEGIYNSVALK